MCFMREVKCNRFVSQRVPVFCLRNSLFSQMTTTSVIKGKSTPEDIITATHRYFHNENDN